MADLSSQPASVPESTKVTKKKRRRRHHSDDSKGERKAKRPRPTETPTPRKREAVPKEVPWERDVALQYPLGEPSDVPCGAVCRRGTVHGFAHSLCAYFPYCAPLNWRYHKWETYKCESAATITSTTPMDAWLDHHMTDLLQRVAQTPYRYKGPRDFCVSVFDAAVPTTTSVEWCPSRRAALDNTLFGEGLTLEEVLTASECDRHRGDDPSPCVCRTAEACHFARRVFAAGRLPQAAIPVLHAYQLRSPDDCVHCFRGVIETTATHVFNRESDSLEIDAPVLVDKVLHTLLSPAQCRRQHHGRT